MAWKVPQMWQGGECWIIGGGPSLTEQFEIPSSVVTAVKSGAAPLSAYSPYLSAIHHKHIIGVNVAFMLGNWIEVAFFGDGGFFLKHRQELAEFKGLKICCNPKVNRQQFRTDHIKYLGRDGNYPKGISPHRHKVSWNHNSGAAAISVAAHTGVKRIVLVGFDMKNAPDSSQHWHAVYGGKAGHPPEQLKKLPFRRHLPGFRIIAKHAERMGIEILNACPDSAITEFKKVSVKDLL